MYKNKTYFITGGTGSLGKALINRLKSMGAKVVVYSRDEAKQALIYGRDPSVECIIGDVRDYDKLNISIQRHRPNYIIHTAALKRIDDMEFYPDECVKTNINGSENVARAALQNHIEKCILISTDKACQPVNVYGSSKFIAERIFTNYDYNSNSTVFASVRYGNVINSRGSVIPFFKSFVNKDNITKLTPSQDLTLPNQPLLAINKLLVFFNSIIELLKIVTSLLFNNLSPFFISSLKLIHINLSCSSFKLYFIYNYKI